MHVILVIAGGAGLLGIFLLFGYLWGGSPTGLPIAAKAFVPVWALVAIANLWVGVTRAGYTVREELPILLLVAAVPIALAALVAWQMSRAA